MPTPLRRVEVMLRDLEAKGKGEEGQIATSWAILALAEQVSLVAKALNVLASQPK